MTEVAFAILGPVSGAVVGGVIAYGAAVGVQQARPRITLQGCTISTEQAISNARVQVNNDLLIACELTAELESYIDRDDDILESQYIYFLQQAQAELTRDIDRKPQFAEAVRELQEALNRFDWKDFERLWANENYALWSPLINAFSLKQIQVNLPSTPDSFFSDPNVREQSGSVLLRIHDGRRIDFYYDKDEKDQLEFCRSIASVFISHDRAVLQSLVSELNKYSKDDKLMTLRESISKELSQFRRLVVSGYIANTGRVPCSLMNQVTLFVRASGHTQPRLRNGNPTTPGEYASDLDVQLSFGAFVGDETAFDVPVTVPAGGLVRFVAISHQPVPNLNSSDAIEHLLAAGSAKAYIGYQVSKPGRNIKTGFSKEFAFVNSAELISIEEKPRAVFGRFRG